MKNILVDHEAYSAINQDELRNFIESMIEQDESTESEATPFNEDDTEALNLLKTKVMLE